jgi:hypothetical protein
MHCFDSSNDDAGTAKRFETDHRPRNSFDASVVLLDDVVQIFVLANQEVHTGVGLDAFNSGRVRTALVDGDLLGHVVQIDGALQKATRCSYIALGSEEEINRITVAINRAVEVLPLTGYLDDQVNFLQIIKKQAVHELVGLIQEFAQNADDDAHQTDIEEKHGETHAIQK